MVFLKISIPKKESKEDKETDNEAFSASKDFKEVIDPMLNSYQRWLDKKIEFPETTKVRKFLNREAVKPAAETNAD